MESVMKKSLLLSLVAIMGLSMVSTNANAAMGLKRWAQCALKPVQYNCSPQERKSAINWLIGVNTAVAIYAAAMIGIGANEVRKYKRAIELKNTLETLMDRVKTESESDNVSAPAA